MFVEVGIHRGPGACSYPDVCRGGHTQGPKALVLALSVDDSRLKELSQVGHQHAQIKRVVNTATIDGKLIQAMNKIPREIFACGQKTLLCHVDNNNNKCICNEPNPSMTIHAWGSECYTRNITQLNLIMHDISQSFPPPSWHPHTRTYAHHPHMQTYTHHPHTRTYAHHPHMHTYTHHPHMRTYTHHPHMRTYTHHPHMHTYTHHPHTHTYTHHLHMHTYAHHPHTQSQNPSLPPLSPSLPTTTPKVWQINSSLRLSLLPLQE